MKTKKTIIALVIAIILVVIVTIFIYEKISIQNMGIPKNYIAKLSCDSGEISYSTYIYKDNNKYQYILAITATTYWGSTESTTKIKKIGQVKDFRQIEKVAKGYYCNYFSYKQESVNSFQELVTKISKEQ